jgi:hypothetical protein
MALLLAVGIFGTIHARERERVGKEKEMKRKSSVIRSAPVEVSAPAEKLDLTVSRGWLNPTKCTLRWLGLRPTRLQAGAKTHSLKYDDQAA